jgi:hypothetical protein
MSDECCEVPAGVFFPNPTVERIAKSCAFGSFRAPAAPNFQRHGYETMDMHLTRRK